MSNVVNLQYNFNGEVTNYPKKGKLASNYAPLHNLLDNDGCIQKFRTKNISLGFDENDTKLPTTKDIGTVDMEIQDSYDGSVNIIMTDDKNAPKLVNSRFSVAEDDTYIIPDHIGNKDTNLYDNDDLKVDTYLQKTISKIPTLEYEGLDLGGKMPCGSYHFYFKFADLDDNETDFVCESSVVMVHIGNINDPFSIRMGMENEITDKCVKFKLSNIDTAYDYVKVYYTRSTSGSDAVDVTQAFEIKDKFPILDNDETEIIIYGSEETIKQDVSIINQSYEYVSKAKTSAFCQNRLFLGNIWKPDSDFETLKELSLLIVPEIVTNQSIGAIDNLYYDFTDDEDTAFGYYNTKNIYYRLGYWPEEYYRFGVVFIKNDFTLSNVFNIRGVDFMRNKTLIEPQSGIVSYSEDGYILDSDGNEDKTENNFGVIRIPNKHLLQNSARPIGVKFTWQDCDGTDKQFEKLKSLCKGFFIVRQKRIPITLALGMTIGKTKDHFGNLPVLKYNNQYFSESFLKENETDEDLIFGSSYVYTDSKNVEVKAAIVPDAVLREPLFNLIFVSKQCKYDIYSKASSLEENGFGFHPSNSRYTFNDNSGKKPDAALFTMVNRGIKLISNGTDYFSAKAGEAEILDTFESVDIDWNKIGNYVPESTTMMATADRKNNAKRISVTLSKDKVVRGLFGTYVGISDRTTSNLRSLEYGDIINIKDDAFDEDEKHYYLFELVRKADSSQYMAVTDRVYLDELKNGITAYRGDCFICNYTQRMIANFIDPEVPTNDKITDAYGWNNNFLVMTKFKSNADGSTYYINDVLKLFKARKAHGQEWKEWLKAFAGMLVLIPTSQIPVSNMSTWVDQEEETGINWEDDLNDMFIVIPEDSKYGKLGVFGETMGIPNTWYEFGSSKIHRGDVNSSNIGHWITFKVLSNFNICMRDEDFWHTLEQTVFNARRSFYPLRKMSRSSQFKIAESSIINGGCNNVLSSKWNVKDPDIPYEKQQYDTRVQYSEVIPNDNYGNSNRIFKYGNYKDLPNTYGALTKLIEWHGNLIAVMEHGILKVAINERTLTGKGDGGNIYVNNGSVISSTPVVISQTFGSTWKDSVIQSENYIYGIDTCGKKIWRTDGSSGFECISDFKMQKFLNDSIDLHEWEKFFTAGVRGVKTHFNNFKKDVMFTFYNDDTEWNLCWNEYLKMFTTFYSWTPSYSENINNIYLTFDLEDTRNILNTGTEMLDKYYTNAYDTSSVNLTINDASGNLNNNSNKPLLIFNNEIEVISSDFEKYPDNMFFTTKEVNGKYYLIFNHVADDTLLKESGLDVYIHMHQKPSVDNDTDIIKVRIKNTLPDFQKVHIWKHGQGGLYDGEGEIKPTTWYGKTWPFEFEVVVSEYAQYQKIYNNLMIISNKVKPEEFQYEIVGETYDWIKYKEIIDWINSISHTEDELKQNYLYILTHNIGDIKLKYANTDFPGYGTDDYYIFRKLPYIRRIHKYVDDTYEDAQYEDNATEVRLIKDDLMNEERLNIRQKCNDIKEVGRIKGNTEYKEDLWNTEIRHVTFKYAYASNGQLRFSKETQSKIRDKYVKVRVKYSGKDLAVIQAIKTIYDISYA